MSGAIAIARSSSAGSYLSRCSRVPQQQQEDEGEAYGRAGAFVRYLRRGVSRSRMAHDSDGEGAGGLLRGLAHEAATAVASSRWRRRTRQPLVSNKTQAQ